MSRKHYAAIADVLAGEYWTHRHCPEAVETLRRVMLGMAQEMKRDNPRFDAERFIAACEIPRYTV